MEASVTCASNFFLHEASKNTPLYTADVELSLCIGEESRIVLELSRIITIFGKQTIVNRDTYVEICNAVSHEIFMCLYFRKEFPKRRSIPKSPSLLHQATCVQVAILAGVMASARRQREIESRGKASAAVSRKSWCLLRPAKNYAPPFR